MIKLHKLARKESNSNLQLATILIILKTFMCQPQGGKQYFDAVMKMRLACKESNLAEYN